MVWVSLKATVLTPSGVDQIRGAITDTLGMFSAVAQELGVPDVDSASIESLTREISTYLAEFRVLVAIDNLETISAEGVIAFLRDLPTGSKVLITSRIGLGPLEHAYPLSPMDEKDAIHFFRRAAAIQNLLNVQRAKSDVVERWCKRLSHSPLAIKWFIAAVALGKDPDDLTRRESRDYQELLRFSFKTLFDSLKDLDRLAVRTIHASGS